MNIHQIEGWIKVLKMPIYNLPKIDKVRQIRGQVIVQVRGYQNNNKHNRNGWGYHNNRTEFKFYPHVYVRQKNTTYDSAK